MVGQVAGSGYACVKAKKQTTTGRNNYHYKKQCTGNKQEEEGLGKGVWAYLLVFYLDGAVFRFYQPTDDGVHSVSVTNEPAVSCDSHVPNCFFPPTV